MKLYEVPPNTTVRVILKDVVPPYAKEVEVGDIIKFGHIDGMYSYCHDLEGNLVHLAAWTEVEIVE